MGLTLQDFGLGGMTEPQLELASGGDFQTGGITVSWLGMIILLVALRILYEIAEEV